MGLVIPEVLARPTTARQGFVRIWAHSQSLNDRDLYTPQQWERLFDPPKRHYIDPRPDPKRMTRTTPQDGPAPRGWYIAKEAS